MKLRSLVSAVRLRAALVLSKLTLARTLSIVLAAGALYYLLPALHERTYVWQSTSLSDSVRPVHRTSCPLSRFHPPPPPTQTSFSKIALVTLHDAAYDALSSSTAAEGLAGRILANRQSYCDRHGYTHIVASGREMIDASRPPAWSKLLIMAKHLPSYDYVLYMDMDVVITDPAFKLASLATHYPSADLIMTEDWSGPNTGVWLVKNTPFALSFLKLAWDQGLPLVAKICPQTGKKHPFEYEQRAIHFLLQTKAWKERGLPVFQGATPDEAPSSLIKHFAFAPQCAFNSYALHPLDSRLLSGAASVEVSQWIPGDFAVHLAGKKGRLRARLLEYYVRLAESMGKGRR